jgi:hypothetical protein
MKMMIRSAFALLLLSACGKAAQQPPLLGNPIELRSVATHIGCEPREPDYFGSKAFSCTKKLVPCGCTLALDADTTNDSQPRINLVRVDLVGCRAGEASDDVAQLVESLVGETDLPSFRELVSKPLVVRTLEQEAHLAVLQSAPYAYVNVRVKFGAQSSASIGVARRTIWLDTVVSGSTSELVSDVPAEPPCSVEDRNAPARGYCDSAPQGVAPCELDAATRSRYRQRVEFVVSKTFAAWHRAVQSLALEHKPGLSMTHPPDQLAGALVGVLPGPTSDQASLPRGSGRLGLQLAAEAASAWRERLLWNIENLFDADLATLMLSLPAPEEVSATVFAERIQHRLQQLSPKR